MKKLLTIIIAFTFIIQSAGPSYALRPMSAHMDQPASKIEADIFFGAAINEPDKDGVAVLRNDVPGKEKGQVALRVCEISDLNDTEIQEVVDALNVWLDEYRFPEISHGELVSRIISNLNTRLNPGVKLFDKSRRIFIAISKPEVNGLDRVDVEGIVEVEDGNEYNTVCYWEIKPPNRHNANVIPAKFGFAPFELEDEELRFIGVGRQLLWYAIYREIKPAHSKGLRFELGAASQLQNEGIEPYHDYSRITLFGLLRTRIIKTLGILGDASESDATAKRILSSLKSSSAGENMYKQFSRIAGTVLDYRLVPVGTPLASGITVDEMTRIQRGITRLYTEEYARDEPFHQFWWDNIRDILYYHVYTSAGAYTTDLSGKDVIFSNNFMGCNALIFKGKQDGKTVTGLIHFVTADLTDGSTVFDALQKEGIVDPILVVTFVPTIMGLISLDRICQQASTSYPNARLYVFPRYPIRDLDVAVNSEGFGIFSARKGSKATMPGRAFLWKEIEGISEKQAFLGCQMFFEYRDNAPVVLQGGSELFSTRHEDSGLGRKSQMALRDAAHARAVALNELAPAALHTIDSAA